MEKGHDTNTNQETRSRKITIDVYWLAETTTNNEAKRSEGIIQIEQETQANLDDTFNIAHEDALIIIYI